MIDIIIISISTMPKEKKTFWTRTHTHNLNIRVISIRKITISTFFIIVNSSWAVRRFLHVWLSFWCNWSCYNMQKEDNRNVISCQQPSLFEKGFSSRVTRCRCSVILSMGVCSLDLVLYTVFISYGFINNTKKKYVHGCI